ncbi:hypothetical protein [uncultured Prevotella sp.]|jgi:hypothetical protein|uniref:hypothetical protein n=1 Tax=uncultured Prevotella sp. TaxID=159272 RepID=UPI002583AC1E|nr:hypothetical protein [uncultured Prevotella sp.]
MKKKYIAPQTEQVIIKTGSLLQVVSGGSNTNNPTPPFDPTPTDEPADSRYYRHNDWDDEDEDF